MGNRKEEKTRYISEKSMEGGKTMIKKLNKKIKRIVCTAPYIDRYIGRYYKQTDRQNFLNKLEGNIYVLIWEKY